MSFCHNNLYFLTPKAAFEYILNAAMLYDEQEMEDAAFDVRLCLKRQGWNKRLIDETVINAVAEAQYRRLEYPLPSFEVPDTIGPFEMDLETGETWPLIETEHD